MNDLEKKNVYIFFFFGYIKYYLMGEIDFFWGGKELIWIEKKINNKFIVKYIFAFLFDYSFLL